jgi:fucose permease
MNNNFGYIGALTAAWTTMNIKRVKKGGPNNKPNLQFLIYWLLFCLGFFIGLLIFNLLK